VPLDQPTWNYIAVKICKGWYPDASAYEYDPSSDWPLYIKSTTFHSINVGPPFGIVALNFQYGVADWELTANWGWQPYYEPQSQALCIADLQTLINEMVNSGDCLYTSGYDTSGFDTNVLTGTLQPKWYTFSATI
jgi:hypothetical protein